MAILRDQRHWANLITGFRLVFLPLFMLAAILDHPALFVGFFLCHSAVDAVDGLVARWLHTQSDFGRQLDTIIDVLVWLPGVGIFLWFVRHDLEAVFTAYPHLFVIPIITAIVMNLAAYHYLGRLAAIHLYTAKLTAAMLSLLLLVMLLDEFKPVLGYLTALIAILYHLEATTIYILQQDQTDENVTSLWQVIKAS